MADKRPITTPSALAELANTDSLIAGASAVLSEQASSPSTPASGYGIVYAKTDGKLYFKNDAGTETDLTATGGGGTNPVINEYTANDTWTKPTAANFWGVLVFCVGAGGGGGSGRRGASSTSRNGGGGGGGGAYAYRFIRSSTLSSSTYAITIGSGGTGGNSTTTNDTNGIAGTSGGVTTFGSLVSARFGTGGGAGTTSSSSGSGSGGNSTLCTPARLPFSMFGGQGTNGSTQQQPNTPATGFNADIFNTINACPGGAGAGGMSASNIERDGGTGGAVYDVGVLSAAPTAGSTVFDRNGGNGVDNLVNNVLFDTNNPTTNGPGSSGAGGASGDSAGTIAGGNGGNGGKGAGGGGGGGSTNGANSGAGGNGGNGLCFVVEYYGA